MEILNVCDLHKSFGETEVLKGIDFTLNEGEILSIIGSSGSGKTTLLRCLNFLEEPDKGQIKVEDVFVYNSEPDFSLTSKERAENQLKFGMVFQSFNLFPHYTVKKNITLAAKRMAKSNFRKDKKKKEEKKEILEDISKNADALLEKVGLADKSDAYPCQLSGGQCQRVAIARALALQPTILCFDEPTSALDPSLTSEVLKVIKALKDDDNRTMIIVTHEMAFARRVSDKIIFMADGVIEEMGTPQQIFENPQSEKTKEFLKQSLADNF